MAWTDQRGEPRDDELWTRLQGVLHTRPHVKPVPHPTGGRTPHDARDAAAQAMREIDLLAQRISQALMLPDAPMRDGSAGAVGRSLVRLCRAFVQHWSTHPILTTSRAHDFNQDLGLVSACLDSCTDGWSPTDTAQTVTGPVGDTAGGPAATPTQPDPRQPTDI
jgi:hypothetical protein